MPPPSPSRTRALVAALSLTAVGVWGCSLVESVQADKVLAATVLSTPAYDLKFLASELPDAGFPFDSGIPLNIPDVGIPTAVPEQTVAQVFFGQRNSDPTAQPKGIAGAAVKLAMGGKSFDLKDRGDGNYALTTQEDSTFVYQDDVKYDVTIASGGVDYTATVAGPGKNVIQQFAATGGSPLGHTANTALQLTRSNTDNVAFTTVIPVTEQLVTDPNSAKPSYTDIPTTALDLLDLIANDSLWKRKVITLPATAFPLANTYYAVTIAAVKRGDTSNNLFTASAFLVGKADVGVVKTK